MATLRLSSAKPARLKAAADAGEDYGATGEPDWRTIDWRQHLGQVEVRGRRMNYVSIGEGDDEPVVFVHGLGGSWQNWLENIPRFARDRRVVAVDLPGFGRSEMPTEEISIRGFARSVDELCDRLGLGHVVVVGNSMGGFTAAEMAISYPERVERLVLVSAAGISITRLRRAPLLTLGRMTTFSGALLAARSRRLAARPGLRHLALATIARHPSRMRADLVYEQLQGAGREGFLPALDALMSYDFVERLPEIACPTLVVWGTDDMLVPVEDADEFERLLPDARKVIMEDTGHVPMLERPQAFNECVADFLAETSASRPPERAAA